MKAIILVITLFSSSLFAGSGDLKSEGVYRGINRETRKACLVELTEVKRGVLSGRIKSATVRSSLFKNGASIFMICKFTHDEEYKCLGQTQSYEFVSLSTDHMTFDDHSERFPELVISVPLGGKSTFCERLTLVEKNP
jgi:hypothetical protein